MQLQTPGARCSLHGLLADVDDDLRAATTTALDRLWEAGCPCATPPHDRTIEVGVRRWRSFDRRNKRRRPTREDRIHDLARGLYERLTPAAYQFPSDPTMRDVECVAQTIAGVLDPIEQSHRDYP